jgi:hypothetical protein
MADVTISGLSPAIPNKNSAIIPFSDGSTTYRTAPSGIVAASPGSILQVLQAVYDDEADVATLNKDWTDVPSLSVVIIPRSTSSKIHLRSIIHQVFSATTTCNFRFMRNSTVVGVGRSGAGSNGTSPEDVASFRSATPNNAWCNPAVGEFIDAPNTTNQITYKVMYKPYYRDARTMRWNNSFGETGDRFRVISTLTIQEIAG